MGMDVYGASGNYFRANVWSWRPVWAIASGSNPEVADRVEYSGSNDGDGLDAIDSAILGKSLFAAIESGVVAQALQEHEDWKDSLPREDCKQCNATGIRTDDIGVESGWPEKVLDEVDAIALGREKGSCNGCKGYGTKKSIDTWYGTDIEHVTEFAQFLVDSGGFEIW